ncbi:MAG: EutN/CcmL family microcompartment protein [Caldilineaceae bacterium]|nr:EutN/CcmL family microcompartment protein [Caldilineaceae bacterium]HRJ44796.1 EutN/CcmL family microcompartment protein [Caldilineaceae bacterium]
MYIGKVVSTVVATVKHPTFDGHKLLLVVMQGLDGQPTAKYDICVDSVQAGVGDRVLVMDEGSGAKQILGQKAEPGQGAVRAVIVGIVDDVQIA